jgi:hypothetical protein
MGSKINPPGDRRHPLTSLARWAEVVSVALYLGAIALFVARPAHAEPTIRALVIAAHISDPSKSRYSESTMDFVGAGAEITFANRFVVEGALGRKAFNCGVTSRCPSAPGGYVAVKWYPRVKR